MQMQMLISAVNQDPEALLDTMKVATKAVLVNQCGREEERTLTHHAHEVLVLSSAEKGVGASRNLCLENATEEIVLFADEDIVYHDGYAESVLREFEQHPEAEMILFNVIAMEGRRTYYNEDFHRVGMRNYGRYPAYSIAARLNSLRQCGVKFSLLFGGGAPYSNGEDSLFLRDCLRAGLKIYASPVELGRETERESTWFHGYNERFFFDRGVLYHFLYGMLARPLALRFLLLKQQEMCREIPLRKAYALMKDGILQGKREERQSA